MPTGWRSPRLSRRGPGSPQSNVGCLIVNDGRSLGGDGRKRRTPARRGGSVGRGGKMARGATAYQLEPCARQPRGPCCTDALIAAGVARVVIAAQDPDPRTDGRGIARLRGRDEVATGYRRSAAAMAPGGRGRPRGLLSPQAERRSTFASTGGWIEPLDLGDRARARHRTCLHRLSLWGAARWWLTIPR